MAIDLKQLFAAFSLGRLQDMSACLDIISDINISVQDFQNFVKKEQDEEISRIRDEKKTLSFPAAFKFLSPTHSRLCPDCGSQTLIFPINIPTGRGNLYGNKSRWLCPICAWEEYSILIPSEAIKAYPILEIKNG